MLVELYSRSSEEATEVLEQAAVARWRSLARRGVAPAGSTPTRRTDGIPARGRPAATRGSTGPVLGYRRTPALASASISGRSGPARAAPRRCAAPRAVALGGRPPRRRPDRRGHELERPGGRMLHGDGGRRGPPPRPPRAPRARCAPCPTGTPAASSASSHSSAGRSRSGARARHSSARCSTRPALVAKRSTRRARRARCARHSAGKPVVGGGHRQPAGRRLEVLVRHDVRVGVAVPVGLRARDECVLGHVDEPGQAAVQQGHLDPPALAPVEARPGLPSPACRPASTSTSATPTL